MKFIARLKTLFASKNKNKSNDVKNVNYNILLTNLEGDDLDESGEALANIIKNHKYISASVYPNKFKIPIYEKNAGRSFRIARKKGLKILAKTEADLLVWGSLKEGDMQLHFLAAEEPELNLSVFEHIDSLDLPVETNQKLSQLFYVAVISAVVPVTKDEVNIQKAVVSKAAELFEALFAKMPDIKPLYLANNLICLSNIYRLHAKLFDKNSSASKAADFCNKALSILEKESKTSLSWAAGQLHLGDALLLMTKPEELNQENSPQEVASLAFEEALKNLPQKYFPDEVARAYTKIGRSFYQIAFHQRKKDGSIEQAKSSLKIAEKIWTIKSNPMHWADVQDLLGRVSYVRSILAEDDVKKITNMKDAASYFRKSLHIRSMEKKRLFSAHNHNNLACSLLCLGLYLENPTILNESNT
ncbi:MAG: hypothetical protein KAJ75_03845, partial [Alphaproteobacteria bacterium]|nr:hypothetical protein [Alphaproteobacteria bacterium]